MITLTDRQVARVEQLFAVVRDEVAQKGAVAPTLSLEPREDGRLWVGIATPGQPMRHAYIVADDGTAQTTQPPAQEPTPDA